MRKYRNRGHHWSLEDSVTVHEDGSCSLEMLNDHQWFENDVSENHRGGHKTLHRTFNVPEDGLLTGTVYFKGTPVQVFETDKTRKVTPKEPALKPDSPILLVSGQGYDTGVIVMEWTGEVLPHEIRLVMSYEYNIGDERNEIG